jgi:hypothetical protein
MDAPTSNNVNTGRCVYRKQLLDVDDDAQRVSKREVAHTCCAFAVNDAFFFFHSDNELNDDD